MQLKPLYRAQYIAKESTAITISGVRGSVTQLFAMIEGRCEGRITGRLHGANHPQSRPDGGFEPDFQGVIETDDDAAIFIDAQGYGRAYPEGRRQIVVTIRHLSSDERYQWLNDVICVATGEVREPTREGEITHFVLETAELIWEPPSEDFPSLGKQSFSI